MGWDSAYHWTKKSTVVAETAKSLKKAGNTILAQKSTTAGVWFVIETKEQERLIYFALIQKGRGEFARKTMTESMGPSQECCPVEFLSMVPCPGGYATEWRARVIAGAEKAKNAAALEIVPGLTLELYGKTYKVLDKVKQSFRVQCQSTGAVYRMGRSHFKSVKVLDTVRQKVVE